MAFSLASGWLRPWSPQRSGSGGAFLFRLAALDLPLFGAYTALQAIHQGHQRFFRLGGSGIVYALTKFAGAWVIIQLGVSIERALIVNVLTTVAGVAFLLTRLSGRGEANWRTAVRPILTMAGPMAVYSLFLMMAGNLNLWLLQLVRPAETAMTGVYLAALNIARVPGFGLVAVAAVILPSISRAVADEDRELVRRYIYQALRFFLLLYLPVGLCSRLSFRGRDAAGLRRKVRRRGTASCPAARLGRVSTLSPRSSGQCWSPSDKSGARP